ncbi:efflux RND transporter periplasmic adaptor subunit [Sideroxydans lithotrophicus]|uniref:Efflux transporter, RND family, MFP subunit n=1 Tax=Sideroxydans lithotrophicus (strain ES-1) TaxID=580332 RepID=D5CTB3_SIDLE|nr:efflux RND transporter periplasmic adaptor subunit [Sideroxydans lithotrophicus]ADE12199.1 efflux transporter, RND family, MFP subunit [Sideroxydans lithotrophicus ES-1]
MQKFHLFLLGLVLTTASQAEELTLSANQSKTLGIVTAPLPSKQQGELAGMPAQVVIPGNQLFTISTPLSAMVEQTLVGVGDAVKKGQPLATLQSPALAEAQRGLLQSSTQAQLSKENLARDEQLWKDGIISESRYRATQSQYRETNAALAERKQMLRLSGMSDTDIARLQSDNVLSSQLTLKSPIDGIVLEKTVSAGQRLDAAIPLFKVARLEPLALEIQAPLASTQELKVGASVAVPAHNAKGKLTAIGRSLSGGNQTILLRAMIQDGASNLRPGQFVEATISTSGTALDHWNIPNSALARIGSKVMIFIETPKGYRSEEVTVLHEGADNSVITSKLKGNEKIAVKGVSALKASLMGIGGE